MNVQRTIRLKLDPTGEQAAVLRETLRPQTACFNAVASYGWEQREANGVALHKATYYPLRAAHPDLPAQLVCAARVRATEAVKSALDRLAKNRPVRCPGARCVPIRHDARSYRMATDRLNADLVGAVNIAEKYRVGAGIAGLDGHPVRVPIVRGMCHGVATPTHKPSALAGGS